MTLTLDASDMEQALDFIDLLLINSDRILLIAFHSERNKKRYLKIESDSFEARQSHIENWLRKTNDAKFNIYYTLNTPEKDLAKKPHTDELTHVVGYHVDIDYPGHGDRTQWFEDTLAKVKKFKMGSTIVNTGNGLQVLYFTNGAIPISKEVIDETEDVNIRIACALGGDSTHDVSRILRMPGLVNWPAGKKIEKGYVPVKSSLVRADDTVCFYPKDFKHIKVTRKKKLNKSARYLNYLTERKYSENYTPITYDDLCEANPTLDDWEAGDDRSEACYSNIYHIMRSMCTYLKCEREDLSEDHVRNISHIIVELDDDCLDHYHEHTYGFGKLGYDIQKVLYSDVWPELDPVKRAGKLTRELIVELGLTSHSDEPVKVSDIANDESQERLSENQAVLLLLEGLSHHVSLDKLPSKSLKQDGTLSANQPCNMTNIMAVVRMMGLKLRYELQKGMFDFRFEDDELNLCIDSLFRTHDNEVDDEYKLQLLVSIFVHFGLKDHARIESLLMTLARKNTYYAFGEWLKSTTWDGQDRIQDVCDTLKSDTPNKVIYIRLMLRQIAATLMSFESYGRDKNGLQISGSLILIGEQGIKKSTWFSELLPKRFISSGTSLNMGSASERDHMYQCLDGPLCVLNEIGQTAKRSETNALKDFLTGTTDTFRRAYHKVETKKPRMTAFCGTANEFNLSDDTGSRRYWPIEVDSIDIEALSAIDKEQLFAQVYKEVLSGKRWWLNTKEEQQRAINNADYETLSTEENAIVDYLAKYLNAEGNDFIWLNLTAICKLIGIKHATHRQRFITRALNTQNVEYANRIKVNGVDMRKVYKFPVPSHLKELLT